MRRLRLPRAELVALVLGGLAVLVAAGAPATAKSLLTGRAFKAGAVGSADLAKGAVGVDRIARSTLGQVRAGAAGAAGAKGAPGPGGDRGDRGPSNRYDVIDARGRRLGQLVDVGGPSTFVEVRTDAGAILAYDPSTSSNYATPLVSSTLFYLTPDCTGQAYGTLSSFALPYAVSPDAPIYGGSPLWQYQAGAPVENISYASVRLSSGCAASSSSVSNVVKVDPAGEAPVVKKPLRIVAAR